MLVAGDFPLALVSTDGLGLSKTVLGVGVSEMKIYVASSWRNVIQPAVVKILRAVGHEVYDFRNPRPDDHGFHWSEIDPDWQDWTAKEFRQALNHPIAQAGFESDMDGLEACEVCVLLLPCGRSAHLEAGWAAGAGKRLVILIAEGCEPELMYRMAEIATTVEELVERLAKPR